MCAKAVVLPEVITANIVVLDGKVNEPGTLALTIPEVEGLVKSVILIERYIVILKNAIISNIKH